MVEINALLNNFSVQMEKTEVHFWDNGDARYMNDSDIITLPDPQWTSRVSGPDYDWTHYWQTVAHEVAHKIIYDWFGGVHHREVFYAVLIALCGWWDLPPAVMDSEIGYHAGGYKEGKKMMALLTMDRIYGISAEVDCPDRPVFDLQSCSGKPCKHHKPAVDESNLSTK